MAIDSFTGKYEFLANPYPSALMIDAECYPSAEHAFQALKTADPLQRKEIRDAATAQEAKKIGGKVTLIPDWDQNRILMMKTVLLQKFSEHFDLKIKLLMTGNEELIQGGARRDDFWSVTRDGKGENHQGKLLMEIRSEIRATEGGAGIILARYLAALGMPYVSSQLENLVEHSDEISDMMSSSDDQAISDLREFLLALK